VLSRRLTRGFEILVPRLLPSPVPYSRSREAVNCKPLDAAFMRIVETKGWDEIHALGSTRPPSATDSFSDLDPHVGATLANLVTIF
jgi:hypothetical protein